MRLSRDGVPVIILSHRKREFLPRAVQSLRTFGHGITDVIVVDDSGDEEHHKWLDDHGYQYSLTGPSGYTGLGGGYGYLESMSKVWEVSRNAADEAGVESVLLWEEDFLATRKFSTTHMRTVLARNEGLAHLNLQRQPVYKVEKRLGYMESHNARGYGLGINADEGIPWVHRSRPFTTNPGLIRREVLDVDWPSRHLCDQVDGGAEPAMSADLETMGYYFGWLGQWNTAYTRHIGDDRKSGIGY